MSSRMLLKGTMLVHTKWRFTKLRTIQPVSKYSTCHIQKTYRGSLQGIRSEVSYILEKAHINVIVRPWTCDKIWGRNCAIFIFSIQAFRVRKDVANAWVRLTQDWINSPGDKALLLKRKECFRNFAIQLVLLNKKVGCFLTLHTKCQSKRWLIEKIGS
jgi:hypothetical protein